MKHGFCSSGPRAPAMSDTSMDHASMGHAPMEHNAADTPQVNESSNGNHKFQVQWIWCNETNLQRSAGKVTAVRVLQSVTINYNYSLYPNNDLFRKIFEYCDSRFTVLATLLLIPAGVTVTAEY